MNKFSFLNFSNSEIKNINKGYFLVFLTAVISGFSIFINKFSVNVINPYIFTGLKNLTAAVFLTALLLALKDWQILKKLTGRQWLLLVIVGLIGGSIPFLLFFKGLSLTTAAKGAFIHKTMFIYVAFLAGLFLREKINKNFLSGGLILLFAGFILLKKLPYQLNQGDFLVFLATLFWAVENTVSKYILKSTDIQGRTLAWARMFFGSFFIFLFLLGTGQLSLVNNLNFQQINWTFLTSIILFGYVMTWYSGLKYIPVSRATAILLLGSPITTFLSLVFGGEASSQEILAGFFIIFGVIFIIGFKKLRQFLLEIKNYERA
jgi:drug/metabolite transporter (DMT)-like permease